MYRRLLKNYGNYQKAKKIIEDGNEPLNLYDFFMEMAWDSQSLAPYGMLVYLISQKESSLLHEIAADILATALCHIEGVYTLSLFHARKALELDPENVENKQFLLFYFSIPERLISDAEALSIAKEVLKKKPNDIIAKDIIKRLSEIKL